MLLEEWNKTSANLKQKNLILLGMKKVKISSKNLAKFHEFANFKDGPRGHSWRILRYFLFEDFFFYSDEEIF